MSRSAIIGTAGHIDHGKTNLIRSLTGVDTDRLKQEKKRGISIELGFTSLTLPSGRRCGVVDVPGHERFVRNMLAGAAGIDLIVLVVAADEGVMPQTREHMDIIELLGVREGIVALTKVDLVDEDWLELATSDVQDYLARTSLARAPIVPVSSLTGQGMDELRAMIDSKLGDLEAVQRGRFVRLPVDRVFSIEGFGTVVTGTLWGGGFRVGDSVTLQPSGLESRIKSLEVHNEEVDHAMAGQRAAVCLHNVPKSKVSRGDWVVLEDSLQVVEKLDVRVEAVRDLPKPIADRSRIRFYLGASEVMGRIVLLEQEELKANETALAQIQLEKPTMAERNDRFVIRSYSPMVTLGGGRVIDVSGKKRRRYRAEDLDALRMSEEGTMDERIVQLAKQQKGLGLQISDLTQQLGQPPAEIAEAVASLVELGLLLDVGKSRLVATEQVESAGTVLGAEILRYEKAHRLRFGMPKSELKSQHKKAIHPDVVESWAKREVTERRLFVRGDLLRRSSEGLKLTPPQKELKQKMLNELDRSGFSGPIQKAFLQGYREEKMALEMLQLLLSDDLVQKLPADILIPSRCVADLHEKVQSYFDANTEMTVVGIKDVLGVSRKQGVPFLEFMDQKQWTRRDGDVRVAGARLSERDA